MSFFNKNIFFNNQNYFILRSYQQSQSTLFYDESFLADESSLSPNKKIDNYELIEWKRPGELCTNPCLFIKGSSIHDVCQGSLGNCWLISALAVLAQHPKCLRKVIPDIEDQEWHRNQPQKYTGMFRICFWRFGEWIEIVVDDRLPCKSGKLVFAHSKEKNEFWSAIVEKAYAKLCGSYEALIGGLTCESLVDFTGGMPEQLFEIQKYCQSVSEMESLHRLLEFDKKDGSLMCASIASKSEEREEKLANGLITTHAYSITGVCKLSIESTPLCEQYQSKYLLCVKIRNPWGEKEYNGPLSDYSKDWYSMPKKNRVAMGWKVDNDGEFWMVFKDFLMNFSQITIVRLVETGLFIYNSNWCGSSYKGYWTDVAGDRKSALADVGGGGQFRIDIKKNKGDICLLHVLQTCKRGNESALGIIVASVERNRNFMIQPSTFNQVKLEYRLGGSRSICIRYQLAYGSYIIKPFLTIASTNTKFPLYFLLRCFTTQKNYGMVLPRESSFPRNNCMCKPKYSSIISRLHILQAELLISPKDLDVTKVFCEITCETERFQTNFNCNPTGLFWDESFLLYRARLDFPVIVKIILKGRFFNSLLGYCSFLYDSCYLNTKAPIEVSGKVFEPNIEIPCTKIKTLKVTWYHTDKISNI